MKILTVDIGTGTQDIFLYDSRLALENGFKLVVPSPTMMIHRRLNEFARQGRGVALSGVMMGGGPSQWAVENLLRRGLPVYATPQAARTFNDDLEVVRDMGVALLGEEEIAGLPATVERVALRDLDLDAIAQSLRQFGVPLDDLSALAVAVFDHGDSPPHISDRQFRFDYLDQRIRQLNRLSAFAYPAEAVPPIMTRMQAVVQSVGLARHTALRELPLVVMDTAPAAVLGATFDPRAKVKERVVIANVGNFHTLAFRLGPTGIEGVFEHHTGLLDLPRLEALLRKLADGSLRHADVFDDHGHGALVYHPQPLSLPGADAPGDEFGVVVTGPRRSLIANSNLRPYFAVPFGDMMITGCFGLLAAVSDVLPELSEPIRKSLDDTAAHSAAPWEVG